MRIFKQDFTREETIRLVIFCLINFSLIYLNTIFPVVYTKITKFYNTTFEISSLIFTIYLLVGTICISVLGKLSDIYDLKKLILIPLFIESLSCFLITYSQNINQIIAFRALMGISMGGFIVNFSYIRMLFNREKAAITTGIFVAANSFSMFVGNYFGAKITKIYGWQTSYKMLSIFTFCLFILALIYLPSVKQEKKVKFDLSGSFFYGAILSLIILSIFVYKKLALYKTFIIDHFPTLKPYYIFNNSLYLSLSLLILSIIIFYNITKYKKNPIIKLDILKSRNVLFLNIIGFSAAFCLFAINEIMSALLSSKIGPSFDFTPDQIGKVIALSAIFQVISGIYSGKLMIKHGLLKIIRYTMISIAILNFLMLLTFHSIYFGIVVYITITLFTNIIIGVSLNYTQRVVPSNSFGIATALNMNSRGIAGSISPLITSFILSRYFITIKNFNYPTVKAFSYVFILFGSFAFIGFLLSTKLTLKESN